MKTEIDNIISVVLGITGAETIPTPTKQQLQNADKPCMSKDEYIQKLKHALDARDAEIARQANVINRQNEVLKEKLQTIADLRASLANARTQRDNLAQKAANSIDSLTALKMKMEIQTLGEQVEKYKAMLKDLEGTLRTRASFNITTAEGIRSLLK